MLIQKDNIYEFGFGRSDQVSKNVNLKKQKLYELIPNFSPNMIKNFHSWIRDDQAQKIILALKVHMP